MTEPKKVGKCQYCQDPIYEFQEVAIINGKKCHKGCLEIWEAGTAIKLAQRIEIK